MNDRATIVTAIENYCHAQCEKDKEVWSALFTENVFHEDPVGIHQTRGKEHVVGAFWDHIVRNDVKIWLTDEVIVRGNEALAIMACEVGPENHRRKITPVVDQFIFSDDGKIISVRGFYNLP
ncbi:MAG: nuclear transport factor 2 family protein [Spongiibacteraceae bacterium]